MKNEMLSFDYKQEFWYVSAFINSEKVKGKKLAQKLQNIVLNKLNNITEADIYRKDLRNALMEMVENISLSCIWVPYVEYFPYNDENTSKEFNSLGYFQFNVEYFKDNSKKKKNLTPLLIQQIPYIVKSSIQNSDFVLMEGILIDLESPIYIFVISNGTNPVNIQWNEENILKYKKVLGTWTVIYSGQWEDYSEELYLNRIKNNLSNRLSELHFINRNSGFVYMVEDNYEKFFKSYMIPYVLNPTPRMRTVMFALRSINESLDLLFMNAFSKDLADMNYLQNKIKNLSFLRGIIETTLSVVYNELDYNRRQHYTTVLKHLIDKFELRIVVERINNKFDVINDALEELYLKKTEENQKRTEKGLTLLNFLFGAGILADLGQVIMIAFSLSENNIFTIFLHSIFAFIITGILGMTVFYYFYIRLKSKKHNISKTVDAVILDQKEENIILVKRKFPPFKDFYALPGGFIEPSESKQEAVIRETFEETSIHVKVIDKIGIYSKPGRDPRGNIESTAFKCIIIDNIDKLRGGSDASEVEIIPVKNLDHIKIAFDHREIIHDALT